MYKKHIRVAAVTILTVVFATMMSTVALAETPYNNYTYTEWSTSVPSPEAYVPENTFTGSQLGTTNFKEPSDFCFGPDGKMYVLDSGNNRVVIFDDKMNFVKEYTHFIDPKLEGSQMGAVVEGGIVLNGTVDLGADAAKVIVENPSGIYVDKDNYLYVCDTEGGRVLKIDQEGKIVLEYRKPTDSTYSSQIYRPTKITIDNNGNAYIISESVYQGALIYDKNGEYMTFYGCPRMQVTAKVIIDRMWKKILSKEARSAMAAYVPVEFTSLYIDNDGFIYTCSAYTETGVEQIRKLNYLGNNIYPYTDNFGEEDIVYDAGSKIVTNFIDICVDEKDFVISLDYTRNRVYVFDQDGTRLMTFGTSGAQVGTFRAPVAVDTKDGKIYVLDKTKANLTVFVPSEYGSLILSAVELYNKGLYSEAQKPWQEVLSINANCEMAYRGIGQAMVKIGDYKNAVEYFRLGYDRINESKAFEDYRAEVLRENFAIVMIVILLIAVLLFMVTNNKIRAKVFGRKKRKDGK